MPSLRALLIGESWGTHEFQYKHAFVGRSGQELARMGGESGLFPHLMLECKNCKTPTPFGYCSECTHYNPVTFLQMVHFWARTRNTGVGITNVFYEHPEKDNEQLFFGGRGDDVCLDIPPFQVGSRKLYLLKSHRHHLEALKNEIISLSPNILIPLGNTACWAVLGQTGIGKIRGTVINTPFGIKAIATYHPAALREWRLRPTIIKDLEKANHESRSSFITRPKNWILTHPTLDEIQNWFALGPFKRLSCDIESGTALYAKAELERMKKRTPRSYNILASLISMIGFARSEEQVLEIPFLKRREEDGTLAPYWSSQWEETRAWEWTQHGLSTGAELVFQNGMYDVNRLLCAGMRPKNMAHDTMLLHHALYPEMPKGLGFLDSIYRNDSPWKTMFQTEGLKRDD